MKILLFPFKLVWFVVTLPFRIIWKTWVLLITTIGKIFKYSLPLAIVGLIIYGAFVLVAPLFAALAAGFGIAGAIGIVLLGLLSGVVEAADEQQKHDELVEAIKEQN